MYNISEVRDLLFIFVSHPAACQFLSTRLILIPYGMSFRRAKTTQFSVQADLKALLFISAPMGMGHWRPFSQKITLSETDTHSQTK